MKNLSAVILSLLYLSAFAQKISEKQNIIIITTDGFRWQELFRGADSSFTHNPDLVKDTGLINQEYWDNNQDLRRQKLMPFFWNVIAKQGQLYGNRDLNNKVNVANLYKISYPGYNEILTGHPDWKFNPNLPVQNKNINILEYLNKQDGYEGKVAAFSSWNIFPYILNEKRSNFPVNSGYEMLDENEDSNNVIINSVQQSIVKQTNTRYDLLTYVSAKEYIGHNHPKVTFIGFGETDELAHRDQYDLYLKKANQIDNLIADLWYYIQTDPFYKGTTTLIITTDHGRGKKADTWHKHGFFTKGSADTWLALLGPGILSAGEMKSEQQIYSKQIAQTVAAILDFKFAVNHSVGKAMSLPSNGANEKPLSNSSGGEVPLPNSIQK